MAADRRALRILSSFDLAHPVRKPADLMRELGVSRASVYRDLAALAEAGLLERVADRGYALGPLIVELDRQIRLADPLLHAAAGVLQPLANDTGGTVLLCRVHASKVLCIHQESGPDTTLPVSYERGKAMTLYRGATSRIILAHLPPKEIERLWRSDHEAIAAAGLGDSVEAFCAGLAQLRAERACVTESEVDPGVAGMAVPLLDGNRVVGSLSVVTLAHATTAVRRRAMLSRLFAAAARIESRIEDERLRARTKK